MSDLRLRRVLDGCNGKVSFGNLPVYHYWSPTSEFDESVLGEKQDKTVWIARHTPNPEHLNAVKDMLMDWELYSGGWLVDRTTNPHLMRTLAQIGSYGQHPPKALGYMNLTRKTCWTSDNVAKNSQQHPPPTNSAASKSKPDSPRNDVTTST